MSDLRKAAVEVLEAWDWDVSALRNKMLIERMEALRQALNYLTPEQIAFAQQIRPKGKSRIGQALAQEQEPVDWEAVAADQAMTIAMMKVEKREWVGLTDEEIEQGLLRSDYALQTAHAWRSGVVFAMTKLKEKNT